MRMVKTIILTTTLLAASTTFAVPIAPPIPPAPSGPGTPVMPSGQGGTVMPNPIDPANNPTRVFNNILQALQSINTQTTNLDANSQAAWSQYVNMQANLLYPQNGGNFLSATGYNNMDDLISQLYPKASNVNYVPGSGYVSNYLNCGSSHTKNLLCGSSVAMSYASAGNLLGASQYNSSTNPTSYVQMAMGNDYTGAATSDAAAAASLAYNVLNTVVASRTPNPTTGVSQMAAMQQIAQMPLSQNWMNQLSTASEPQLLRSVAILLAYNNFIQYQLYQQQQTTQALLALQLLQTTKAANALQNR